MPRSSEQATFADLLDSLRTASPSQTPNLFCAFAAIKAAQPLPAINSKRIGTAVITLHDCKLMQEGLAAQQNSFPESHVLRLRMPQ